MNGILERLVLSAGSSIATMSYLTAELCNTMVYLALATGGTCHLIFEDRAADLAALRIADMDF